MVLERSTLHLLTAVCATACYCCCCCRVFEETFLYLGCAIGYWQGDIMKLVDDVCALKPAIFIGVPRVYDRIYQRVMVGLHTVSCAPSPLSHRGTTCALSHHVGHTLSHVSCAPPPPLVMGAPNRMSTTISTSVSWSVCACVCVGGGGAAWGRMLVHFACACSLCMCTEG